MEEADRAVQRWLCRRYVPRRRRGPRSADGIAREYGRDFGFRRRRGHQRGAVRRMAPRAVGDPVRLVHSGACLRNRNLMASSRPSTRHCDVTLDLFLTPNDPGYLLELQRAAARPVVRVHEPCHMSPGRDPQRVRRRGPRAAPGQLQQPVVAAEQALRLRAGAARGGRRAVARDGGLRRECGVGSCRRGLRGRALSAVVSDLETDTVAQSSSGAARARELSAEAEVGAGRGSTGSACCRRARRGRRRMTRHG